MADSDRLNLMNENEPAPLYTPEGKPGSSEQKLYNKGELYPSERMMPAHPLKDETTRRISHRGGQASPRTEHY